MDRRSFLAAAVLAACGRDRSSETHAKGVPPYLRGHTEDPEAPAVETRQAWFREAKVGLELRYGVYSQLGRGPRVQFDDQIPVEEYDALKHTFDPSGFDAEGIAATASDAGMGYVSLTARHADGFCLFRTVESDFNCLEWGGRDLVAELTDACDSHRLGVVLNYAYAADWRHPYFFPPDTSKISGYRSRPAYAETPAAYRFAEDEDFLHYVRYAHGQLEEILYRYRPLAGIRLEPAAGYFARPDLFPVSQMYALLREADPGMLIAFGQGVTGDEGFVSTQDGAEPSTDWGPLADAARRANQGKPVEVRTTLERATSSDAATEAIQTLAIDLEADGSMHPNDVRALQRLGQQRLARRSDGPSGLRCSGSCGAVPSYPTRALALSAP